jgi:hypothetical protein
MRTRLLCILTMIGLCIAPATAQQDRPPRPGGSGRPPAVGNKPPRPAEGQEKGRQQYSIEQAISDQAQLHTIAFNGLAFMTGDFGSSTFIPPGKVSDFFGFQYMRDIDSGGKGHNPMFLDRIAGNVVKILSEQQLQIFERAAREQEKLAEEIARKRFPLIAAFHQQLAGDLPAGSTGLSRTAVIAYGADLFALDAELAWQRAKAYGAVAGSLDIKQKSALSALKFGDFNSWPEVDRDEIRRLGPRGASKLVSVGYMTLVSEFFSWYAGSVEADTYFCPERHGTYFGGFYLKDMPAMGQKDYDISTSLTGDTGAAFLALLNANQRSVMTGILDRQRNVLEKIIDVRRAIATRLREFLAGNSPLESEVTVLGRGYGELDGELAYEYAVAFASIYKTMDAQQKEKLAALRSSPSNEGGTAFLYSDRISVTKIPDSSFLFGTTKGR